MNLCCRASYLLPEQDRGVIFRKYVFGNTASQLKKKKKICKSGRHSWSVTSVQLKCFHNFGSLGEFVERPWRRWKRIKDNYLCFLLSQCQIGTKQETWTDAWSQVFAACGAKLTLAARKHNIEVTDASWGHQMKQTCQEKCWGRKWFNSTPWGVPEADLRLSFRHFLYI